MKMKELVAYVGNTIPDNIKEKIDGLNANLYNGPNHGTWDQKVIDEVKDFVDSYPVLYYDNITGCIESEISDCSLESFMIPSDEIADAILGKELSKTLY